MDEPINAKLLKYHCDICGKDLCKQKQKRHERSAYHQKRASNTYVAPNTETVKYPCTLCDVQVRNLTKHYKSKKHQRKLDPSKFPLKRNRGKDRCVMCNKNVVNLKSHFKSAKHLKRCCTFVGETSANEGDQKIYRYEGINNTIDPVLFLSSVKEHVKNKCLNSSFPNFKLTIELNAQFYKEKPDGSVEVKDDWFHGGYLQAINY